MSNNILIGQYIERDSIIHRLDPRTKLLGMIAFMLGLLTLHSLTGYVTATLCIAILLWLSKVPLSAFIGGLKPLWFILSFTLIYHAFVTQGDTTIWSWSFLHLTAEGLLDGLRLVWRIVLLVVLASLLTLTTKPLLLAHGLEKVLSPLSVLKVPVEQLALMMVIAIRFIPTIMQELERILLAQKARGYDITTLKLPQRIFAYIPILVPLLFTVIQRADTLTSAIDARAYGNGKERTNYRELKFRTLDYWAGGTAILFAAILVLIRGGGV